MLYHWATQEYLFIILSLIDLFMSNNTVYSNVYLLYIQLFGLWTVRSLYSSVMKVKFS